MSRRAPANNGVHSIWRTPNWGIRRQGREDFEVAKEAARDDPIALKFLRDNEDLWFPYRKRSRRGARSSGTPLSTHRG